MGDIKDKIFDVFYKEYRKTVEKNNGEIIVEDVSDIINVTALDIMKKFGISAKMAVQYFTEWTAELVERKNFVDKLGKFIKEEKIRRNDGTAPSMQEVADKFDVTVEYLEKVLSSLFGD